MPPIKELHFFDRGFNFRTARVQFRRAINRMVNGDQAPAPTELHFYEKALLNRLTHRRESRSVEIASKLEQLRPGMSLPVLKIRNKDMDWYCSLFNGPGVEFTGDITPGYSVLGDSLIAQIAEALPALKIVLLVRNPVDRFWSQAQMQYRKGNVDENSLRDPDFVASLLEQPSIKFRSYASETFLRWSRFFSDAQIGVFTFDMLKQDPRALREEIFAFLGLTASSDEVSVDPAFNRKARQERVPMIPVVRQRLEREFAREIDSSREIFGSLVSAW